MSKVHIVIQGNYALSGKMNAFSDIELAEGFRKHLRKELATGEQINIITLEVDAAVLKEEDM